MTVNLIGTVTKKQVINRTNDTALIGYLYNTLASVTAAIVLFCMNGFSLPSLFTIVLGIVFGIITALQQVSNIQALKLGPLSYTTVIASLSTMIPTLCGAVIWGEHIAPVQWIGILLCSELYPLHGQVSALPSDRRCSSASSGRELPSGALLRA